MVENQLFGFLFVFNGEIYYTTFVLHLRSWVVIVFVSQLFFCIINDYSLWGHICCNKILPLQQKTSIAMLWDIRKERVPERHTLFMALLC